MQWDKISDIILISSLVILAVFAVLGLIQLIQRKSLWKVDRALLAFIPPLVLMAITYFVFYKFIVLNVRPNGSGEPSFPSTHVMVVATIFFISFFAIPKYVKSNVARTIIFLMMLILLGLVCAGRILSNMHWLSDVIGALIFSAIFTLIYYFISRDKDKKEDHNE